MTSTPEKAANTSDTTASSKKSKSKGLAVLLKDVYHFHVEAIAALETKVEELEKKCSKLDRVKTELLHKGHDLQKRYDSLVSAHERVKDDLVTANNRYRLQIPCEICKVLKGQLEQQEKLYNVVVGAMKNKTQGHSQGQSSTSQLTKDEGRRPKEQIHSGTNHLSDISNTANPKTKDDTPQDLDSQSPTLLQTNNQSKRLSLDKSDSAEEISPGGGKGRSLKLTRNSKRSRCKYTEELVPESKKPKRSSKVSAQHQPPSKTAVDHIPLLLPQDGKPHTGHHDSLVHILVPQTCDQDSVSMETDTSRITDPSHRATKDLQVAKKRRKLKPSQRPNIVIPETVPFDLTDYSSEEDQHQVADKALEDSEDVTASQQTIVPVLISPPSHASTPLPSAGKSSHHKHPNIDASPEKIANQLAILTNLAQQERGPRDARTADVSPPRRHNSTVSEPSSPIFGQSKDKVKLHEVLVKSARSPSLFDEEDDSFDAMADRSGAAVQIRDDPKRDAEQSRIDASEGSPSVISGKIKSLVVSRGNSPGNRRHKSLIATSLASPSKLKRESGCSSPQRDHWSVNSPGKRSARKLVQTTLKMSGLGQSKPNRSSRSPRILSYDPDETVDPGQPIDLVEGHDLEPGHNSKKQQMHSLSCKESEEEKKMFDLAREQSLKQYHLESAAREGSLSTEITFMEPRFTSTQKISRSDKANLPIQKACPSKNRLSSAGSDESEFLGGFKKPLPPKHSTGMTPHTLQKDPSERRRKDPDADSDRRCVKTETPPETEGGGLLGDMNGTIDPNVHLSQYNTPQETYSPPQETFLEPTSIYSIEEGKYEMPSASLEKSTSGQRSQTRSNSRSRSEKNTTMSVSNSKTGVESSRSNQSKLKINEEMGVYSEDLPEPSATSVVFGRKPKEPKRAVAPDNGSPSAVEVIGIDLTPEHHHGDLSEDYHDEDDSFDRLPKMDGGPGYAYVEVVRKQDQRKRLDAHVCRECDLYYDGLGLSDEEKRERMKGCRHRARFARPDTPEHYWSIDFPDTQEIQERGYMNTTQAQPSKFRRKRGLRPLFLEQNEEEGSQKEKDDA